MIRSGYDIVLDSAIPAYLCPSQIAQSYHGAYKVNSAQSKVGNQCFRNRSCYYYSMGACEWRTKWVHVHSETGVDP